MKIRKVYIATSSQMQSEAVFMRDQLLHKGFVITSRWIDNDRVGKVMGTAQEARWDYEDVRAADAVVFINPAMWGNHGTGGRHNEVGYAQALGKPIFLLGAITNVFHKLPGVCVFDSADDLIATLAFEWDQIDGVGHLLTVLANRVHDANAKWWIDISSGEPLTRNVGELLMLTVSELAEAGEGTPQYGILLMEVVKVLARAMEGHRKTLMDDKLTNRKMFDVEIIDAIIRLADICGGLIPDAGDVFDEKMAFNATRVDHSHAHRLLDGGKKY